MLWKDSSYKKNKFKNSLLSGLELIEHYFLLLYLGNKLTFLVYVRLFYYLNVRVLAVILLRFIYTVHYKEFVIIITACYILYQQFYNINIFTKTSHQYNSISEMKNIFNLRVNMNKTEQTF